MTQPLRIDRLTKTYTRRGKAPVRAVLDVSVTLDPGAFKVVQGPSGSGKTTLLLAAGGLLRPDSGSVRVADTDLYSLSADRRARFRASHIGFVFQQYHLIPYLSVLENVLAPTLAYSSDGAGERARRLIDDLGLSHRITHPPSELSAGERQRVALSRALLNEPKLLLADEPTGNLDADNTAIVLDHLRRFAAGGGAVLVATHDTRIEADERYVLRDGVLVESADPREAAAGP